MVKRADPKLIEQYREAMLTNPESFKQKLTEIREKLRSQAEGIFIDRDLTLIDETMSKEQKKVTLERLDAWIISIGQRIDAIDETLSDDAEAQASLMGLNRTQRRAKDKALGKKRQAKAQEAVEPLESD